MLAARAQAANPLAGLGADDVWRRLEAGPSAQVKAAEPMGEALPNSEIFRRLASAMEFAEPELHESDSEIIATLLKRANLDGDFRAFAARAPVHIPAEPMIQFRDLTFPTPSGRIEIASESAAADGHPRVPQPLSAGATQPAPGNLRADRGDGGE